MEAESDADDCRVTQHAKRLKAMANDESEEGDKSQTKSPAEQDDQQQQQQKQDFQPQQKRFSFYDARDIGEILADCRSGSSLDSVARPPTEETKPNPHRHSFWNPDLLTTDADENKPNKQVGAQVQSQTEREDAKQQQQQQEQQPPVVVEKKSESDDEGNSDTCADEILRSLQETEYQRKQILQSDVAPVSTPSARASITGVDIAASTGAAAVATPFTGTINSNTNPYEDSIRTALDLLRKHKLTPPSPSTTTSAADTTHATDDYGGSSDKSDQGRTPREQNRVVKHRSSYDYDDDDNAGKALDYVVQEAKLKSKQHKEVMARYANKLEEFKSNLSPEEQLLQVQLSSSYTQSYDEGDGNDNGDGDANDKNVSSARRRMQMDHSRNDNNGSSQSPSQQQQPPNHIHRHIKPSLTEDSTGLVSELSQFSNSHYQQRSQQTHSNSPYQQQTIIEGVEEMLVAILEASKNKGTTNSGDSSCGGGSNAIGIAATDNISANSGDNTNEVLLQVIHKLLPQSRSMDTTSINSRRVGGGGLATATITSKYSAMSQGSSVNNRSRKSSVVDELLAEVDDSNDGNNGGSTSLLRQEQELLSKPNTTALASKHTQSSNAARFWAEGDEKKMTEDRGYSEQQQTTLEPEPDPIISSTFNETRKEIKLTITTSLDSENDRDVDDVDAIDDSLFESDSGSRSSDGSNEDDELDTQYSDHDESYGDEEDECTNHGGVLGPLGGTTGVVLDLGSDDSPSSPQEKEQTEYFSSVANYKSSALTPEQEQQILDNKRREEILANYDVVGSTTNIHDEEATELMRTLCAHLLPFGVDQNTTREESVPLWNEDNPDEPGYRIIRLSKSQLRRVECAFDAMITRLKHNLLNGVEGQFDANFVRELEEAERLLDNDEKCNAIDRPVENTVTNATTKVEPPHLAATNKEEPAKRAAPHPEFPGVRAAGNGEMGDLEYFQLPIIYKSHVTGFEPTKDIKLEPGNIIAGQYLVESELGSAAFSTAYKCVDFSSDENDVREEVCLKVIKNTKDFFDQSLDEIKILELLRQTGQCDENYILRVKTFFYYREHLIIVTELLRRNLFEFGTSILDNDEEPYFTLPRLAYITRQCLVALRFVHNLGLVHSDVKPENILLGSYSRAQIKLIDFGSSCYLTDRQSSYIQSRSYRAPEVVLGLPYDGKIDVWSLGCVVAEMFTGEVTFQNDSIISMLSRIESYRGSFPRHMIAQGRQSNRFFTKSGLLYEVVEDDSGDRDEGESSNHIAPAPDDEISDDDDESKSEFDVFQPKSTRLSSRLGFEYDLMDDYGEKNTPMERKIQQMFTDFVGALLTIDPDGRPTAEEALNHPYMVYAASLTDDQIKYPSS